MTTEAPRRSRRMTPTSCRATRERRSPMVGEREALPPPFARKLDDDAPALKSDLEPDHPSRARHFPRARRGRLLRCWDSEALAFESWKHARCRPQRRSGAVGTDDAEGASPVGATGVRLHNCFNLHAKVFVFGKRAIIGSTNVSRHSAEKLIEAEESGAGARPGPPSGASGGRRRCGDERAWTHHGPVLAGWLRRPGTADRWTRFHRALERYAGPLLDAVAHQHRRRPRRDDPGARLVGLARRNDSARCRLTFAVDLNAPRAAPGPLPPPRTARRGPSRLPRASPRLASRRRRGGRSPGS
jgi:hypothetical protein